MKKVLFLTWEKYHRRPELLAQHFNGKNIYISYGQRGNLMQSPFRYLVQTWQSWRVLCQEQPDVIFVQNPPILCSVLVFLYARRYGARYIIDSHTGAFVSWKWRWSLGLHRLLSRRALVTLVHNKSQEQIVKDWGCRYLVLAFSPGDYPIGEKYPLLGKFNVAVIGSLLEDEPLDIVFDAASRLPDVFFYVTGSSKRLTASRLAKKPSNCYLTGYMPYEKYVSLLRNVDLVMTLTTRDHTLLMGSFEAISLEKPLIVSDWPILRDYFSQGTVFVSNTAESIYDGILNARHNQAALQQEMSQLNERLVETWKGQFQELQRLINGDSPDF